MTLTVAKQSAAAKKAWATRRSPTYRARKTAKNSQVLFEKWAESHGWRVVYLDATSGNPRTGIVDAVLVRVRPRAKDQIDIRLVQLKAGSAGLKSQEFDRLCAAVDRIDVQGLAALCDDSQTFTLPVSRTHAATGNPTVMMLSLKDLRQSRDGKAR